MFLKLKIILNEDATDNEVAVTILTGVGDYYCSGNEIVAQVNSAENVEKIVHEKTKLTEEFVATFINYPKLLIAVVNGPAIGAVVTILPLCDVVYASDRATFNTTFIKLGLCPEGCSSYLLPRILGRSKASEMLLLGKTITAREAYQFGLVSEVVGHEKLNELLQQLQKYGKLPVNSVKRAKELVTINLKETLHKTNKGYVML